MFILRPLIRLTSIDGCSYVTGRRESDGAQMLVVVGADVTQITFGSDGGIDHIEIHELDTLPEDEDEIGPYILSQHKMTYGMIVVRPFVLSKRHGFLRLSQFPEDLDHELQDPDFMARFFNGSDAESQSSKRLSEWIEANRNYFYCFTEHTLDEDNGEP
jgi:hypothetical protein